MKHESFRRSSIVRMFVIYLIRLSSMRINLSSLRLPLTHNEHHFAAIQLTFEHNVFETNYAKQYYLLMCLSNIFFWKSLKVHTIDNMTIVYYDVAPDATTAERTFKHICLLLLLQWLIDWLIAQHFRCFRFRHLFVKI